MKVLASDYDGTLKFERKLKIDYDILNDFRAQGNKFGIVTGRTIGMIKPELDQYKLPYDFIVGTNGGIGVDSEKNPLFSMDLSYEKAMEFIDFVKSEGDTLMGVSNGDIFATVTQFEPDTEDDFEKFKIFVESMPYTYEDVIKEKIINSFFIRKSTSDKTEKFLEILREKFGHEFSFHYNKGTIDVCNPEISKATGVKFIKEHYKTDEIYVIGDGFNDLPMIQAYNGFSLNSAEEGVKEHAQMLFDSVTDCLKYLLD